MNWLFVGIGAVIFLFVVFMMVVIRVVIKNKSVDDVGPTAGSANVSQAQSSVDPDRF